MKHEMSAATKKALIIVNLGLDTYRLPSYDRVAVSSHPISACPSKGSEIFQELHVKELGYTRRPVRVSQVMEPFQRL
jgi:acetoin utilization deacetylase AcuC-like enzyme